MNAIQLNEVPCDRIRAIEWKNGRLRLAGQRILAGKQEQLNLDHLTDGIHALGDVAATWCRHENRPKSPFQILNNATVICYHDTVVTIHG